MKKFLPILKRSKLFLGINENELENLLKCLSATVKEYKKDEYIFRIGDNILSVGLNLSGSVHIIKEDYWGNKTILTEISEGSVFGESYACSQNPQLAVSAVSMGKTKIMLLDVKRIIKTCPSTCIFHARLIQNLIIVLANKNIMLTEKIEHISQRTTRSKLLSYLSEQSQHAANPSFDIPFNRQQLADYLSVDRSAMSNELCKLRDEGVIKFEKKHFVLL